MFEDIKAQERSFVERYSKQKAFFSVRIAAADQVLALKQQPAFRGFIEEVERLRSFSMKDLIEEKEASAMWRLQGEVRAYDSLIDMLKHAEQAKQTASVQLAELEARMGNQILPGGKVKPAGVS